MKPSRQRNSKASEEAARWFTRMNASSISNGALAEFWEWRRSAENDAAYNRVESLWRSSGQLSGDPDIQAALAGARARNRRDAGWLSRSRLLIGGAALAAGAGLILVMISGTDQTFATKIGEQRDIVLADGSRIRLDTNSAITVRLDRSSRRIALTKGQAFFNVAHLPSRPLTVLAGQTVIRDVGTRFDVRRDGPTVRVVLIEGAVAVGTTNSLDAWPLRPGQQLVTGSANPAPAPVDLAQAPSRTTGQVVFDDVPLSSAAAEMNRYGVHRVVLQDASAAAIHVSGAFDADDTNAFVTAVTRLYDLRSQVQPDGSILLLGAGGERAS